MPLPSNGLVKLAEECGELTQISMKILAYPVGKHPDGKGDLRTRLQDEMADVLAAIVIVTRKLGLNEEIMQERADAKLALFELWDGES
jgi:NTP pyrophosphatase (non-canonical NTP hydrolase)